jgi:chaperonin GroEL
MGRNVVLSRADEPYPQIVNDGVTIAREIDLANPEINVGVRLIQEVAKKSDRRAGDGTTTSIIMTQAIVNQGLKYVKSGMNPVSLRKGIMGATNMLVERIPLVARKVTGVEDLEKVATVSTGGDKEMAKIIASVFGRVDLDAKLGGATLLEDGNTSEDELEVSSGMRLDRSGFESAYYVTDMERMVCELRKPRVLVTNYPLLHNYQMIPIMEEIAKTGEPLLVVAEETKDDALALLVVNKLRGTVEVCSVRAPFAGARRKQFLQDIALATGATFIDSDLGMMLQTMTMDMLGVAESAVTTREHTTLRTSEIFDDIIAEHVKNLKKELDGCDNVYDEQKLQYRVAALSGGVAVIKVGAATETELKDKKLRYEDALNSVRTAIEMGVLPGGGSALVYMGQSMREEILAAFPDKEERAGAEIVLKAIEEPVQQIARNAGMYPGRVLEQIKMKNEWGFGMNAATGKYENLLETGVLDSASVVLNALTNSASIAGLVLTTQVVITERAEGAINQM